MTFNICAVCCVYATLCANHAARFECADHSFLSFLKVNILAYNDRTIIYIETITQFYSFIDLLTYTYSSYNCYTFDKAS